jgi:hypothetical protein
MEPYKSVFSMNCFRIDDNCNSVAVVADDDYGDDDDVVMFTINMI